MKVCGNLDERYFLIDEEHLCRERIFAAMDDLFRRADAAICDSRGIRSEVRQSLAEARIAVAKVQRIVQWARAENERANALVRASGAAELKTLATPNRQSQTGR
jgi:hypothetical protein